LRPYLDVPGWKERYTKLSDAELRDVELTAATRGHRQVWLVAQGYNGLAFTRHWFSVHGFHIAVGETYEGNTRLELYDRGSAATFGPREQVEPLDALRLPPDFFAISHPSSLGLRGAIHVDFSFRVHGGEAYTVSFGYRAIPPSSSRIVVRVYDRQGQLLGTFPHTKWYDLPVNGVWLSEPFGFVAPKAGTRAVLELVNLWGQTSWRSVAVHREAGRVGG
jgi:hypothetical protein